MKILLLPLLILIWLLVRLGALMTWLPKLFFNQLKNIHFDIKIPEVKRRGRPKLKTKNSFKLPNFNFPEITLPTFSLPKIKTPKRAGRPRTQPLFRFYLGKLNRVLKRIYPTPYRIATLIFVVAFMFFSYSFSLINIAHDLPSPERLTYNEQPLTSEFYDRNGKLLYRFYEGKNRTLTKLDELPKELVHATIAIEDKNFYHHNGVDIFGVARAIFSYFQNHDLQGGSTLTQQLIKNTLLTPERTIERKAREVLLAFWAERIFTKDQILQMYFNEVPYGGPAWGIQAASQTYFNKDARKLTLAESSYLAGLPASPTSYSPYGQHPELGKERQKEVLRRMVEDGYITQDQASDASKEELNINQPVSQIKAPHFVMYVRQLLADKYGEKAVSQGGLKVVTTLDLELQEQAESIVSEEVSKLGSYNVSNGAAMVTDAKTGQILAMVGSKNYFDPKGGNFNVTTALRQPGSSIKPITYVTGFKQGYTPGTILLDNPVSFKNAWENYSPVNYDGKFHGPVTIRTALGSSYNIPAVKMLALVGIPEMVQTATDMGITSFNDPSRYGLSLTLGGGEVKMTDMMTVFGTFSQMGVRHDSQPILTVTDPNGLVLQDNRNSDGRRVLPASSAFMIADILSDNKARTPAFGPTSLLQIPGKTVAVKTGTTDNKRDNWTFGFTPEYVVGVWVGNNNNQPMDPRLTSGVTGAAPIWNRITSSILKGKPDIAFARPLDIAEGAIEGGKDIVNTNQGSKSVVSQQKKKVKDEKEGSEKETITFTDPFSTYIPDQNQAPKNP